MADVTPFLVAFIAVAVILAVGRNRLPRWARFTLTLLEVVIIFFAVAFAVFR